MGTFLKNNRLVIKYSALSLLTILAAGCSDDGEDKNSAAPETYSFESRFSGESSVSYSGQVLRHLLIEGITGYVGGGLQSDLDAGNFNGKTQDDIESAINNYYFFDSEVSGGQEPEVVANINGASDDTGVTSLQSVFNDVSSGKDLSEKIAGNDATGQTLDWSEDLVGWGAKGSLTPENLVQTWVSEVAANAFAQLDGQVRTNESGEVVDKVYVSTSGLDYKQLIQKFLLGAVTYSQATDDYLDNDLDGKGLNADNTAGDRDGAKPYTALEHAWDEGFGYFGAARNFLSYDDDHIAGKGSDIAFANQSNDANGDGKIDLTSEHIFGHAANAGKRDRGASAQVPTDFSTDIFKAFVEGRHIISAAEGALSNEQINQLIEQRDIIVANWEKVIAATVIHYINEVIVDMSKLGTEEYSFLNHAKHWSELKGFSLSLQFNPFSQISELDFALIQTLIGDKPHMDVSGAATYKEQLIQARHVIANALSFSDENVGDQDGLNGW